jgi:hypothetical protein
MATIPVHSTDIDKLVDKLSRLELGLDPAERALLVFMLGVAADTIHRTHSPWAGRPLVTYVERQDAPVVIRTSGPAPSIEDEFATAFVAGGAGRMHPLTGSVSVGPGPVDE